MRVVTEQWTCNKKKKQRKNLIKSKSNKLLFIYTLTYNFNWITLHYTMNIPYPDGAEQILKQEHSNNNKKNIVLRRDLKRLLVSNSLFSVLYLKFHHFSITHSEYPFISIHNLNVTLWMFVIFSFYLYNFRSHE